MAIDLARRLAVEGLLSDDELAAVVVRRAAYGEPVPVALQFLRILDAAAVESIFDRMGFAPATRLSPAPVSKKLPPGMLRSLWALPIGESPTGFVVAMVDPTDSHAIAELAFHLKRPIDPRSAPVERMRTLLAELDPPRERKVDTLPAAAAAPPPESHHMAKPSAAALADDVMALARKQPHRRMTPAYGEVPMITGRVPNLGSLEGGSSAVARAARRIGQLGGTISGSLGGLPGPPETPPTRAEIEGGAESPGKVAANSPSGLTGNSESPIPLKRRAVPTTRRPATPASAAPLPKEALYTIAELRQAADRDAIGRVAARGLTSIAQRAAFFVVKSGVVQGWEGATVDAAVTAGMTREALRNLWIPVTSQSVFRVATEKGGIFVGLLSESSADLILAAALGGRPTTVLLAPIDVRGKTVGFLYADGLHDLIAAERRAQEIVAACAEALERWIVNTRGNG